MARLHNHCQPPGLERVILGKIPKWLLGGLCVPLFMSLFVRLFPPGDTAAEVAKNQAGIDILGIAIFITVLTAVFTVVIGCIIVVFMKGPAYVADAYRLEDADHPDADDRQPATRRESARPQSAVKAEYPGNGIRAILFDFGGVLAEEGFRNVLQAIAAEQGLAVDDMTAEGMNAVYDSGYVLGKGSESDFWALLRDRTGFRGDAAAFSKRMYDGFVIRPWMMELVRKLRSQGYITGILSDQVDWLDRMDEEHNFYRHFDHVFNSYHMGKGKRDPSHFTDVAAMLGLPPAAVLFVDDSESNVQRARSTGMHAILYADRDGFMRELQNVLATQDDGSGRSRLQT